MPPPSPDSSLQSSSPFFPHILLTHLRLMTVGARWPHGARVWRCQCPEGTVSWPVTYKMVAPNGEVPPHLLLPMIITWLIAGFYLFLPLSCTFSTLVICLLGLEVNHGRYASTAFEFSASHFPCSHLLFRFPRASNCPLIFSRAS